VNEQQTITEIEGTLPTAPPATARRKAPVPAPLNHHPLPVPQDTSPATMLAAAVQRGADIAVIERLMDLRDRVVAEQRKAAFDRAFAAFKAEAVKIVKNTRVTDGPLKGKSYATLSAVVNAVTETLSAHGLSTAWAITKDIPPGEGQPGWLEVTCYLRHVEGHQESVSMGGPPDAGGAKNALQARASSKSYLERYTLKAILGLAEQEDDDDGNGGGAQDEWTAKLAACENTDALARVKRDGEQSFSKARNVPGYRDFMRAVAARKAELEGAAK
jgi:hypothetical protein